MAKRKKGHNDEDVVALRQGLDYTWTIPDGGNLASMRAAVKHGQTLTLSPVRVDTPIKAGDMALIDWHEYGGTYIFHVIHEVDEERFLIANSLGKINGWVERSALVGVVTKVIDPEPRPTVVDMLERLRKAYGALDADPDNMQRLVTIADDMAWYAIRIGTERHDLLPKLNMWSYAQILWHLMKRAERAVAAREPEQVESIIDYGKRYLGKVVEILEVFAEENA